MEEARRIKVAKADADRELQKKGAGMIEVLKQLVDALENHSAIKHPQQIHYRDAAIQAGKQAISELESQEPVAWIFQNDETGRMTFAESQQIEHNWEKANPRYKKINPLYTHPPQRTWQGLTDDEVERYWDWEDFQTGAGRLTILEMVRDIESKLKERNT